jgi:hypothetical protein
MMQVQKNWEESRVIHEYKSGRVIRARYGYRETETGYCVVLGSCDALDKLWEKQESRVEHMAEQAAKETLCLRLDVDDYRTFLGFSPTTTSDQRLLFYMHRDSANQSLPVKTQNRRVESGWLNTSATSSTDKKTPMPYSSGVKGRSRAIM